MHFTAEFSVNVTVKGTISGSSDTEMVVDIKLSWNDERIKNAQSKVSSYFEGDMQYSSPMNEIVSNGVI